MNTLSLVKKLITSAGVMITFSAAACDVPISFYLISDQTLLADAGLVKGEAYEKAVNNFRDRAASNLVYLGDAVKGHFSVCIKEIRFGDVAFLSQYPALKIDVSYWDDVKMKVKNGTLSKEERGVARKLAEEACARVILGMGGLLKSMRESSAAPLPRPINLAEGVSVRMAELPLIVIVTGTIYSGSTCDNLTSVGLAETIVSTFNDPLDFFSKLGKNFLSYEGAHLTFGQDNPARTNAKPFLRPTRAGIHLFGLDREDKTFVHEIGHQLGLTHLHGSLPCSDNDNSESGVTDTPPMSGPLEDVTINYPQATSPEKFPLACKSVTDEDGNVYSRMPFDNFMNQGENAFYNGPMRFTESQLKVMSWMVNTMRAP